MKGEMNGVKNTDKTTNELAHDNDLFACKEFNIKVNYS